MNVISRTKARHNPLTDSVRSVIHCSTLSNAAALKMFLGLKWRQLELTPNTEERELWLHFSNKTNFKWVFFSTRFCFFLFSHWHRDLESMHLDSLKLYNDWVAKCQSPLFFGNPKALLLIHYCTDKHETRSGKRISVTIVGRVTRSCIVF